MNPRYQNRFGCVVNRWLCFYSCSGRNLESRGAPNELQHRHLALDCACGGFGSRRRNSSRNIFPGPLLSGLAPSHAASKNIWLSLMMERWCEWRASSSSSSSSSPPPLIDDKESKPTFHDFLRRAACNESGVDVASSSSTGNPSSSSDHNGHAYLSSSDFSGYGRRVFLETYGCQMNFSDMEIVRSILSSNGFLECGSSCEVSANSKDLARLILLVNVVLSQDETYADISPVRRSPDSVTAFVSIMRGCDNMCTYCIVPFTRGRERSRPIDSILKEVQLLSHQGVKEVTLLGQNVNSYRDMSESLHYGLPSSSSRIQPREGFRTVYRDKTGGRRFSELLDAVSRIDPQMRIRFTSPHPKDFPDEVLEVIGERANVCKQLHLPAQSGNSKVLNDMGRGYTRDTYMDLVTRVKHIFSTDISLTSDFIAGFCGESEEEHRDSISLIRAVKYDFCYCFPYSMRERTRAHRRLVDSVEEETKKRRANELIGAFREESLSLHRALIGRRSVVLVEGVSRRSPSAMAGRVDGGTKLILPQTLPTLIKPGDYVLVEINEATSQVLKGSPLYLTNISGERIESDEELSGYGSM